LKLYEKIQVTGLSIEIFAGRGSKELQPANVVLPT
jgi:hypothetical protein